MLLEQNTSKTCAVRDVPHVPAPDSVASGEVFLSDSSALLRYTAAFTEGAGDVEARFSGVCAFYRGAPNDEALGGHRLWGKGLRHYSFQEVLNSDWIAELERRNRVHPRHSADVFNSLRHFVVTFKDETVECVARTLDAKHENGETQ